MNYERERLIAVEAARAAGEAVRDLYERAAATTYVKSDGSPVTDADLAADHIIREMLGKAFPDDAMLTEELADDPARLSAERLWIVDPIDGTQQFVERTGEFDILIALSVVGEPVVGVLLQPATMRCLSASKGGGAWLGYGGDSRTFTFRPVEPGVAPRLLTSSWLNIPDALPGLGRIAERLQTASPAISPCGIVVRHFLPPVEVADHLIGLPTHADQTMAWEWDFAAADIVVHEAGGAFTDPWGERFVYNKPVPRNRGGVVVSVDPASHAAVIAAIEPEVAF